MFFFSPQMQAKADVCYRSMQPLSPALAEIPGQAVENLAFDVPKMNAPPADTPIPYNQLFDRIRNHLSFC
jgi:hypothetical protein